MPNICPLLSYKPDKTIKKSGSIQKERKKKGRKESDEKRMKVRKRGKKEF